MFSENEKVVYSGHGVAVITRIVEKKIGSGNVNFFELKFLSKDMTILVPVANAQGAGMRKLSSKKEIGDLFAFISTVVVADINDNGIANWNKRNKEYQVKIRTGDLIEIGEIYRDLNRSQLVKELSFGEKDLLQKTESFLVEEISLVNNQSPYEVEQYLRTLVNNKNKKSDRSTVHLSTHV